ncbi:hypothetical protein Dda_7007 [Drechslerella dactyloides]|uniref:Uncharacterized protein n=1 Tax=Drechslerella dactyloides TaxID=74499 RepID=A0AAD6ITJ4_DREDA|nr:hypothetical protein Dda_7007 [Drechslerella dactyloides]
MAPRVWALKHSLVRDKAGSFLDRYLKKIGKPPSSKGGLCNSAATALQAKALDSYLDVFQNLLRREGQGANLVEFVFESLEPLEQQKAQEADQTIIQEVRSAEQISNPDPATPVAKESNTRATSAGGSLLFRLQKLVISTEKENGLPLKKLQLTTTEPATTEPAATEPTVAEPATTEPAPIVPLAPIAPLAPVASHEVTPCKKLSLKTFPPTNFADHVEVWRRVSELVDLHSIDFVPGALKLSRIKLVFQKREEEYKKIQEELRKTEEELKKMSVQKIEGVKRRDETFKFREV